MLKLSVLLLASVLLLSACQANPPDAAEGSSLEPQGSGGGDSQHDNASDEHPHTLPHGHDGKTHGTLEAEPPVPTVDLVIHEDPKSGWNLQIVTENFRWSPEEASTEHVPGHGHAHLYIDGQKVNRVYGEWQHIPELTAGTHEIMVVLSANSHEDLTAGGAKISDAGIITALP